MSERGEGGEVYAEHLKKVTSLEPFSRNLSRKNIKPAAAVIIEAKPELSRKTC